MEKKAQDKDKKKLYSKKIIGKSLVLIAYAVLLLLLYNLLMEYSDNIFIVLLILAFILITLLGPLLKPKKSQQRLYKKMFPGSDKSRRRPHRDRRDQYKREQEFDYKKQDIKPVNLNYKYRKPLINKCRKCGMILPNFVKKCPNCGEPVND